jgi:hypothetical protein
MDGRRTEEPQAFLVVQSVYPLQVQLRLMHPATTEQDAHKNHQLKTQVHQLFSDSQLEK